MATLTILGFKPGVYKVLITRIKLNSNFEIKNSDIKILKSYNTANDITELKEVLKEVPKLKYRINKYQIGYETEIKFGRFKESFDYTKNSDLIIRHLRTLKKQVDKEMEDILTSFKNNYLELNNIEDVKKMYSDLKDLIESFFPMLKDFHETITPLTELDYLDINIEMYKMVYSKIKDLDYETSTEILKDDFLKKLLKYKMDKYGKEIFKSLGMDIVGETQGGYIISETIPRKLN